MLVVYLPFSKAEDMEKRSRQALLTKAEERNRLFEQNYWGGWPSLSLTMFTGEASQQSVMQVSQQSDGQPHRQQSQRQCDHCEESSGGAELFKQNAMCVDRTQ